MDFILPDNSDNHNRRPGSVCRPRRPVQQVITSRPVLRCYSVSMAMCTSCLAIAISLLHSCVRQGCLKPFVLRIQSLYFRTLPGVTVLFLEAMHCAQAVLSWLILLRPDKIRRLTCYGVTSYVAKTSSC